MTMPSATRPLLLAMALLAATVAPAFAGDTARDAPEIRVDIPVALKTAKVVFNIDQPLLAGDMPVGIGHMATMVSRFDETGTKWTIIGVFHSGAGYMLLNDQAYNRVRKIQTGNPYEAMIAKLIAEGVQIEECAVTMKNNGWGNADLLPDVKVNAGANLRIVQLVQQGYVMLPP